MLWNGPTKLEGLRDYVRLASRLGKYEDVSGIAGLLASEQFIYVTGLTLFADHDFC
ncbi:MAG: hypothetical protein WA765_11400 [Candidatus Acidiferrum sp.]